MEKLGIPVQPGPLHNQGAINDKTKFSYKCKCCTHEIDLWDRKPVMLQCGHTTCEKCFNILNAAATS